MRITGTTAQDMSRYANEISDGGISVCNVGADLGHGARVIDGDEQLVWLGQPREATAYYLGQIEGYRDVKGLGDVPLPSHVQEARDEINLDIGRKASIAKWYARGKSTGAYRGGAR